DDEGQVQVAHCGKPQCALKSDLPRRAVQKITAAHDVGDCLAGVVDDHGELVCEDAVASTDHNIPAGAQIKLPQALRTVVKSDPDGRDLKACRGGPGACWTPAARSRVTGVARHAQLAARATALKGRTAPGESFERFDIPFGVPALILDLAIPQEAER